MADGVNAKWRNKDAVMRKFQRLAPEAEAEMEKALEKPLSEFEVTVKNRAPVSAGIPSHGDIHYRDSIEMRKISGQIATTESRKRGTNGKVTISKNNHHTTFAFGLFASWIWHFVELGTVNNRASPHIYPSYRQYKKRFRSAITRGMTKARKKVFGQ